MADCQRTCVADQAIAFLLTDDLARAFGRLATAADDVEGALADWLYISAGMTDLDPKPIGPAAQRWRAAVADVEALIAQASTMAGTEGC